MSWNKFFYPIREFKLFVVLVTLQYFKTYFLIVYFKTHLAFFGEMVIYFS